MYLDDLFENEQCVLNHALSYIEEIKTNNAVCSIEEYSELVNEYKLLLKQVKRFIKISDKTTIALNTTKLNLMDKIHYDKLTEIYNRRFFDENTENILSSLAQTNSYLSLLMIDVDFFKLYNDTYGHSAGDKCLHTIATILQQSLYENTDFAARYGGEEFVIVLPETDKKSACILANDILKNILNKKIEHIKNMPTQFVTVSIGVTTSTVTPQSKISDFLITADKALYLSKNTGRNKFSFIPF